MFKDDPVELKIGGLIFGGWKTLKAEVGIEQCSGAFNLTVMDRWSNQATPWQIHAGDGCELLLAGQTVIKGYVDRPKPFFSAKDHGIHVNGRDKTMDVIDCSAIYKSGQWKNVKLDRIARDICKPFGIEVIADGDVGAPFQSFNIEICERAFEAIDRAARMRGMLVTTDGTGRLILTRASTVKSGARLVEGQNILYGELDTSWKERYSEITVKGQGKGTATEYGAKVAHGKAKVTDPAITRYRPLIVISEHHGKGPSFAQRAEWERNVRRGRGTRASIQVQGWTMDDGRVWKPNLLASVESPYLGINEDLLIAKCLYEKGERTGTITTLELVHPSAFDILEGVKTTKLGRKSGGANGLEISRKHAKDKAKGKGDGVVVEMDSGNTGSGGSK